MERARKNLSGFTMIEVVIVMLIMGILTAVAAPRYFDSLSKFRVEAASQRMVADMKLARREAQRTSSSKTIVFDLASNSYSVTGIDDFNRPGTAYRFNFGQSDYQVALESASFAGATTLTYDMYGRPSAAGVVVMSSGNNTETVGVDVNGNVTQTSDVSQSTQPGVE